MIQNTEDILEFYFMHNLYMLKSWLFRDYENYYRKAGGATRAYSWEIFNSFSTGINVFEIHEIIAALNTYLESEDQFFSREHFPFAIEFPNHKD